MKDKLIKQFNIEQFNWFNVVDHIFHTNVIAYCQQNWYVALAIYTDLVK